MSYAPTIRQIVPAANARHVEAWMVSENEALDTLDAVAFRKLALEAAEMAAADPDFSELLAASLGIPATETA